MTEPSEHVDPRELRRGIESVAGSIEEFLAGLDARAVSPATPLEETRRSFEGTIGDDGVGVDGLVEDVRSRVLPAAMGIPHPLYLGLLNCSPLNGGVIGDLVVSSVNDNTGAWKQGPPFVSAEHEVLRVFRELTGLPPESHGMVLPGGSYACLHAFQLAREKKLSEWRERGVDPRATVYVSASAHFSAVRSAHTIGVLPRNVVHVPTTGRGELDAAWLRDRVRQDFESGARPFLVVGTAGTTGTGAIDPLEAIADVCDDHDLWFHVDACYGGAAALLPECRGRFAAMSRADSVAIDPHKWMLVPMVAGVVLCRHVGLDARAFDIDAPYIPNEGVTDAYRVGFPTSRRAAGFTIWATLRAHGLSAIAEFVRANNRQARAIEERLARAGFEVLEGGELSIACARWPSEDEGVQRAITDELVASGVAWFGTYPHGGRTWMRFALVNARTSDEHVERLVDALVAAARAHSGGDAIAAT